MPWSAVLAVAAAVGCDGLWAGLTFGLRRVRLGPWALLLVSGIAGGCSWLAMSAGVALGRVVPLAAARWVSAGLLLATGVTSLYDAHLERALAWGGGRCDGEEGAPREALTGEAMLLGLAVAVEAGIAAFALGLAGFASAAVPWFVGAAHWTLVGLGNLLGLKRLAPQLASRFAYLPGGLLMVLALLRMR